MIKSLVSRGWVSVVVLAFGACTPSRPIPDLNTTAVELAPLAAEYRTTSAVRHGHERSTRTVEWRIWREPARIETENIAAHTGELWQRDGDTLFHRKMFHQDKKSIEYQMDDLKMSGLKSSSLARQALLVDPELLRQLKLTQQGWRDRYPYHRYTGNVDGHAWDVVVRTDLNIATRVRRSSEHLTETTEMMSAYPLAAAPWHPSDSSDYEIIEFADLGDREEDPFVAKVQAQLGAPHPH